MEPIFLKPGMRLLRLVTFSISMLVGSLKMMLGKIAYFFLVSDVKSLLIMKISPSNQTFDFTKEKIITSVQSEYDSVVTVTRQYLTAVFILITDHTDRDLFETKIFTFCCKCSHVKKSKYQLYQISNPFSISNFWLAVLNTSVRFQGFAFSIK